jgi:hypothetical protein
VHDATRGGIEAVATMHRAAVIPKDQIAGQPLMSPRQPDIRGVRPDFVQE